SLLLLEAWAEEPLQKLVETGHNLMEWLRTRFDCEVTVVISGLVEDARQLYKEYNALETVLENKFFFDEGTVLLTNHTSFAIDDIAKMMDDLLLKLTAHIRRHRFEAV